MSVEINETNFPGGWFRSYVSNTFDMDHDGWLSDEEIAAVTVIDFHDNTTGNKGSLQGLEFFTELTTLKTRFASYLDVSFSTLTKLRTIEIGGVYEYNDNRNKEWDFSGCTSLRDLTLNSVMISTIAFPSSIEVIDIDCAPQASLVLFPVNVTNCQNLKSIKISPNATNMPSPLRGTNNKPYLETVDIPSCYLNGVLDFSSDTALQTLKLYGISNVSSDQQASLNLTGCTSLTELNCTSSYNFTGTLDLSTCSSLTAVYCRYTCFTGLILGEANSRLAKLLVYGPSSKPAVESIDLTTTPILANQFENYTPVTNHDTDYGSVACDYYAYGDADSRSAFYCDIRTTVTVSSSEPGTDPNPSPGTGIEINDTNFPDAGFRSYISENFDTDNDGWLSDSELANMASIDISEKNDIFSLQGIGLIGTLKALSVNKCSNITSISIVGHPSLEDLRIYNLPSLTTVTLTDNLHLNYAGLWASLNLATITIQNCPELKELWCGTFDTQSEYYSYSLSSLTLSGVPKLERLWIQKGQLTYLDVSACASLKNFRAYSNDLTAINFGNIQSLELIAVYDNELTSLIIPPSSASQQIHCYQNSITSVDVSRSPVLVSAIKQNTPSQMTITGNPTRYGSSSCHIIVDPTVIVLLAQPMSRTEDDGDSVAFSVEAKGENLAYQWQVSHDGSTWSDLAGATESACSRVVSETTDGDQYRCKITDGNGNSVISQAATLTLRSAEDPQANLVITRQPASQTVAAGSSVTFSIEAQGNDLTYRWEYCLPNTQNWIYADGDSSSITIPNVASDHNGVQYRCIVTDGSGSRLTSNAATLAVTSSEPGTDPNPGEGDVTFKIVRQPKNTTAISGAEATFSVVAQGTDLSYQWQFSSDSGSSWLDVQSDGQSNVYTFTVGDAQNGYLFRCVIAQDTETLTTDSVRLTVRNLPSAPERKTYLPSEMADAIRRLGLAGIDLDDIPFGNMPDGLAITTLGSKGATSPEWYEEIAEAINVLKTGIDIEDYQIFKVKTITENGEYAAVEDDCYGFSLVDVDVFGGDSIVDRTVSEPYINDKITKVGAYAFCKCDSLPAVDVPNCANILGWAFSGCTSLSFVSAPNCSMVGSNAFEYCVNLLSISLPNCKTLSDYAFSNCRSLALVSSPLCEIIGDGAFQGCTSLTSVEFPMCGTIGNDAFNACTRLVLADFPVCGNVGVRAFQNCTWLMSVSLPNCSVVGVEAFKYCSGLLSIEFPLCTSIGSSAFLSCTSLAEVSFPECTNIGAYAFYKCFSLAYASFSLCTFIGQSAFGQCSSMSYADFPVCSSIGSYAFSSCTNLASANFPLCTIVPGGAFYKCERLSYVSIPNCSQIGSSAFYSCHDLLAISLPNCSIIGSNAFYSCSNLSALYLYGSSMCKLAASNALYSTAIKSGRGWIYVPESLYSSYIYATNWSYYGARFSHTVNVRATMSGTTLSLSGAGVVMSNNALSLSAATVSMSSNQLVFP